MSKRHSLFLEVFRLGYELELIERQTIVDWADNEIASMPDPPYFLLELSLSPLLKPSEFDSLLRQLVSECISQLAWRVVLGLLDQAVGNGKCTLPEALSKIRYNSYENLASEEQAIFRELDEELEEALDWPSGENMIRFLGLYAEFRLDNYDSWVSLSEEVEQKLGAFEFRWPEQSTPRKAWWKRWFRYG